MDRYVRLVYMTNQFDDKGAKSVFEKGFVKKIKLIGH